MDGPGRGGGQGRHPAAAAAVPVVPGPGGGPGSGRPAVSGAGSSLDVAARIRRAAAGLFVRQGFRATGLRQVAAAAGVAVGTVYNHYRDKQALLRAVADEQAAGFARRLARVHLTPGRPAAERWAAFRTILEEALPWLACETEAAGGGDRSGHGASPGVGRGAGAPAPASAAWNPVPGPVTAVLHQGLARFLEEAARRGEVVLPRAADRAAGGEHDPAAAAAGAAMAVLAAALGLWRAGCAGDLDWLWHGLAARGKGAAHPFPRAVHPWSGTP
ncbi:TetR/AcrR family transcriptional regulator [Thermaerobacter marianensis]|nr:TetR/AcrR family transcriptional regulator [Thermaerobacter marianensis]